MSKTISPELLAEFAAEATEMLARIAANVEQVSMQPALVSHLEEARRAAHQAKGAASMIGFADLAHVFYFMEEALEDLRDGRTPWSDHAAEIFEACVWQLGEGLNCMARGEQPTRILAPEVAEALETLREVASEAPRPVANTPAPVPAELLDVFRMEAEEHLTRIGENLGHLEQQPANQELLLEVRRSVHTLKGASGSVGFTDLSKLSHRMEDLLDRLAEAAEPLTEDLRSLLVSTFDALCDMSSGSADPEALRQRVQALYARYDEQPASNAEPGPSPEMLESMRDEPAQNQVSAPSASGQYVRVPIERLDELARLISELLVNRSTFEQHLGAYGQETKELDFSISRLKRVSQRLDADVEVTALRGGFGQLSVRGVVMPERGEFDALEFDRYTDLHLVSRDLAETAVDVTAAASELRARAGDFDSYLNRLSRLTSDIQDRLMRMRMVPLATLSARLDRTVRVTAERTGKPTDFVIEGERVELDKTVLEEMAGPIEHALRNAVDHGIESEALRRAVGKPARGRITLEARYEGTQVVLTISDDGAGINPELVRAAAVDRGLLSEADASRLPDERVLDLVFHPGFTTVRQVSEVSGRGVGMDVVKSTVARLKGAVELTSSPGEGTRLNVRLPLTLSIMRVILVKANGQTFALPANVVTRILRVSSESVHHIGGKPVLRSDGKSFPLLRLSEALRLEGQPDQAVKKPPALLLQLGDRSVALVVDEVADAREVVVKTMGALLKKVRGFTGATLMGDGKVVLILNPGELVEGPAPVTSYVTKPAHVLPRKNRALEILTVDDSVSVRRVLARMVESAGWKATPAKDGLEALELLQRGWTPDAILLDVEMPRMDGYELLGALRGSPRFKQIPVVMLTSRSGEKHRKKAFQLGATDYLVKPYQDETLLTVVRRVVREAKELAGR